jgi:hypothetical protein
MPQAVNSNLHSCLGTNGVGAGHFLTISADLPCFIRCKDKRCVALPIEEVGEDSAMTLDEVVRESFLFFVGGEYRFASVSPA